MVAEKRKREFFFFWFGKTHVGKNIFNFVAEFMGSIPSKFSLHSLRYTIPVAAGENSSLGQNPDYCCCQKAR